MAHKKETDSASQKKEKISYQHFKYNPLGRKAYFALNPGKIETNIQHLSRNKKNSISARFTYSGIETTD